MFSLLSVLMLAGLAGPLLTALGGGLVPVVVGELIAGVVLGHTGTGSIDPNADPLPVFKAIGFAMLMLTAGTHVDVGSPTIRQGFLRGLGALVIVGITAVPAGILVDHAIGLGHPALLAVLISGSSAAVAFPILAERGVESDRIAVLIAWVALADSTTVVVMPLTLSASGSVLPALGGDAAIIAGGVLTMVVMDRVRGTALVGRLDAQSRTRGWALQLRTSVVLLVGLSAIAERTGASTLVAGFLAGMVIVRLREPDRLNLQLAGLGNGFFVPLFFVILGAQIDLRALFSSPSRISLALALAAAAVLTHLVAAAIMAARGLRIPTGLAASAQLGMPAAAASLGLSTHLLAPADAAALVAAGCLTLIPATIGSLLLARGGGPAPAAAAGGAVVPQRDRR